MLWILQWDFFSSLEAVQNILKAGVIWADNEDFFTFGDLNLYLDGLILILILLSLFSVVLYVKNYKLTKRELTEVQKVHQIFHLYSVVAA
jgi:hypothetical protein